MKAAFIDVETTGLDPQRHSLWSLALRIYDAKDGLLDSFEFKCRPLPDADIDREALRVGAVTFEQLQAYEHSKDALSGLRSVLERHVRPRDRQDKLYFIGYNAPFDAEFVRAFFDRQGDKYFGSWFWHPPICVMNLAAAVCALTETRVELPNFKLHTVARHFNLIVDEERLHDAIYDIEITQALYERCMNGPWEFGKIPGV